MRSSFVVLLHPFPGQILYLVQIEEQTGIRDRLPVSSVEAFDVAMMHGFTWLNVWNGYAPGEGSYAQKRPPPHLVAFWWQDPAFFCEQIPQQLIIHRQVRIHAFQSGVFFFQLLHPLYVTGFHTSILALPIVKGGIRNRMFPGRALSPGGPLPVA